MIENSKEAETIGSHPSADKAEGGAIRIQANGSPELKLERNGNIYWDGRLLTTDVEIVEGFRSFLTYGSIDRAITREMKQWCEKHDINCVEDIYQRDSIEMDCQELVATLFEILEGEN